MLCGMHTQKPLFFSNARTNHFGSWRSSFEFQSSSSLAERPESSTRPNAARAAIAPIHPPSPNKTPNQRLCDQLNNTTSLLDLLLGITAEVTSTDDDGNLGKTALAEDLGVAEGQEVDDGGGVGLGAAQVGITLLGGDKGPKLCGKFQISQAVPSQGHPSDPIPSAGDQFTLQLAPFSSAHAQTSPRTLPIFQ